MAKKMSAIELDKTYSPADFEERIYQFWMDGGYFKPKEDKSKGTFVIVIPPPNVTGVLHMGHGLNNSLQDILTRYNRMLGKSTLWLPGTDHAGIATQNVVERKLLAKGVKRRELGREKFLEETWKVKEEHHSIIKKQLMKIGSSCDWSRERFTMDEGLSEAVRKVFVILYERDLLYKGEYLVNWCPQCGTALADDEVDHAEEAGKLYDVRYPLADGSGEIVVATTRPETMFGDTAVAVHPDDDRYKAMVGKKVKLPLTDREIPIIADTYCKMDFGSGAVKMTPAHDPNDWEVGMRHNLERLNILNPDATLNDNVPEQFRGMDCKSARKETLKALEEGDYLVAMKDLPHQVGHCYRCGTIVEPYMSKQWFVRMAPMAKKALDALKRDDIAFYPKKWENTYTHWLDGIRDWCISRQLWWGHRIPAWTCSDCGELIVPQEDPTVCPKCGGKNLEQDPDVLDTWFSSWLWPFSTLGWPNETSDLKDFFPTSTLVTAYDIIFFWVARMIMASEEFMGKPPFKDIYITGLVRDEKGRKMSKSLGNGLDPLEVVDQYGADALKFTISYLCAQGEDLPMGVDTFKIGSKFCNKVWNATRYILMNIDNATLLDISSVEKKPIDNWIEHRLNEAAKGVEKAMKSYRFDEMTHVVYEFFWNDFCDWYVEGSKISLYSDNIDEKNRAITLLLDVLARSLRLLHPFIPFLTEEIYRQLPNVDAVSEPIIVAPYPEPDKALEDNQLDTNFNAMQDLIQSIRTLRSEFTIPPSKKIKVRVKALGEAGEFFGHNTDLIAVFIKSDDFALITGDSEELSGSVTTVGKGFESYIFIRDAIDVEKEITRMKKAVEKNIQFKNSTERKLANEKFVSRAPEDVITKEKEKLAEFTDSIAKMSAYLDELQGK